MFTDKGRKSREEVKCYPLSSMLLKDSAWTIVRKMAFSAMMMEVPVCKLEMVICPVLSLASTAIMPNLGRTLCTQRLCFGIGYA